MCICACIIYSTSIHTLPPVVRRAGTPPVLTRCTPPVLCFARARRVHLIPHRPSVVARRCTCSTSNSMVKGFELCIYHIYIYIYIYTYIHIRSCLCYALVYMYRKTCSVILMNICTFTRLQPQSYPPPVLSHSHQNAYNYRP